MMLTIMNKAPAFKKWQHYINGVRSHYKSLSLVSTLRLLQVVMKHSENISAANWSSYEGFAMQSLLWWGPAVGWCTYMLRTGRIYSPLPMLNYTKNSTRPRWCFAATGKFADVADEETSGEATSFAKHIFTACFLDAYFLVWRFIKHQ